MTESRGWSLPESHLLPDAVVAYVDGELSPGARERASAHLAKCLSCAADVRAQRQAREVVRHADTPCAPSSLLASLRSIPEHTELPTAPDNLAVTEDGQLVAIQRPDRVAGLREPSRLSTLGGAAPIGSAAPLGSSSTVLGSGRRKAAQGAGVVVSGLVLSALALVTTYSLSSEDETPSNPAGPPAGVLRAQFPAPPPSPAPTTTPTPAGELAGAGVSAPR